MAENRSRRVSVSDAIYAARSSSPLFIFNFSSHSFYTLSLYDPPNRSPPPRFPISSVAGDLAAVAADFSNRASCL